MESSKSEFIKVIVEKKLFQEYLLYYQDDQTQTDRILFYETFEFLQELIEKEMPNFMRNRRGSRGFPVSRFMKAHGQSKAGIAFIPSHLLHHVSRIYDFYFGADAPVNIDLDQELIYKVKTDYFSKQVPVDWLDDAVFQVLESLYYSFHGFVDSLKAKEITGKRTKLSNSHSSLQLCLKDYKEKRSSIYSNYCASYVSDSSYMSSINILDHYFQDKPEHLSDSATSLSLLDGYYQERLENSSDLATTLSPDWQSENEMRDVMKVELINSRPAKRVLSKVTRQLYLDSSGLCFLNMSQ